MLPLRDTEPNRYSGFPAMTVAIIAANTLVHIVATRLLWSGDYASWVLMIYHGSIIPRLIVTHQGGGGLSAVTALFLHGDWIHLISNMFILLVFARRVEDACGPWRFLAFYLTCGVAGDIADTLVRFNSPVPAIGASGAVFGVMGAYLVLYPGGRIRTLVTMFFIPLFPRLRAAWIVVYMAVLQIISGLTVLATHSEYHIGYWAHLGGFFCAFTIFLFLRPEAMVDYRDHQLG